MSLLDSASAERVVTEDSALGGSTGVIGPAFDLDEALEEIPGGFEMAQELAGLFLEEYAAIRDRMRRGLIAGDPDAVRAGAHTLKSSAAIFAAHGMADAACRAEQRGKAGDLAGAAAALADLEREGDRVMAQLRELAAMAGEPPRLPNRPR